MKLGWLQTDARRPDPAEKALEPHFLKNDTPCFATMRTEGGLELPPAARDRILARYLEEHGKRYALFAAVVMGDHAHLVLQALHAERGWPFDVGSILASLQDGSAQEARKVMSGKGPLWQPEMLTVELRSQEMLDEKCEFVRQNPVRWKAVKAPEDYRWLWLSARM